MSKADGFSDLAFFAVLAKKESLSAAARELGVTPPAVTRRLAVLEQRLGVRLLNRTTRRISLTGEGERYVAQAARILADVRELEESVSSSRAAPKGLLRINATLGFGRTTIAPLVSHFAQRYPEVEVQLQLTDRAIDLVEDAFDLGIRFGELPDTRLSARKIMSNRRYLCASPNYLKRRGVPASLDDLAQHDCIIHRQNDDAWGIWRFTRARKRLSVKVRGTLSSNDGDVVLGWALDGHGILLRSEWDLAKYLESGRLRVVLPDHVSPPADLYVFYPSRQQLSAKVRVFIDFLIENFGVGEVGSAAGKTERVPTRLGA
ncbi:MAG: bacterial regulatory helix-turn-helix, lysR family protein [Herminiimonas sp.]|nr:bacterial regulatory helix-turn-helix, lysR family protein [Herminiimonas sp.]